MYRDAWTSSMHLVTTHCPVEPFGRLSRSSEIDHQIELKRSLAATFPTNMDSASEQPKFNDIMGFKTYTSCLTSVAKLETNVSPKSALQKTGRKFWISAHQIMLKRQKRLLEEGACVAFSVFSTKSFHPFLKSGKNTTFAMGPCLLHSTQNCSWITSPHPSSLPHQS